MMGILFEHDRERQQGARHPGSLLRTARRLLRTLPWGDQAGAPGPQRLQVEGPHSQIPPHQPQNQARVTLNPHTGYAFR